MKLQIAKIIFHNNLTIMKKLLDLMAFKLDKRSSDYRYLKKEIMDYFYNGMAKMFTQLENEKILEKCPSKCKLRQGYKDCKHNCGGSGWILKRK